MDNKRTVIIDGKVVDLDKTPLEELRKIQNDLDKKEKAIREQIEKELENY